MNLFTLKWFGKFFTSLGKFNPQLRRAKEMKATMGWQEYKPFVDEQVRAWLKPMVEMAGVEFVVKGQEKIPVNQPVIYTPNHAGAFDIPAVILSTPVVPMFMAKKELMKLPMVNKWMDVVDCVFVDRNNKDTARSSLHDAIEKVKTGRSLVIFPEGTRSKDGKLGEFRGGAMKVAMETGAVVVPVLIEGSRERLEATSNVTAGKVFVTFLDPIETKGLSKEDFFRMPSEIRALLQAELDNKK
ncbi:MAG: 1-acyl-sn-glycerol-3-phosphate acyltransferase [Clostridia bacterium]|nr:1-acyl-sn-glycerol-3-phosphate acyltransferase [Clostridia bacterium]